MPRDGYRSVALTEEAHEELRLLKIQLSGKLKRELTLSDALGIAATYANWAPDDVIHHADREWAHEAECIRRGDT